MGVTRCRNKVFRTILFYFISAITKQNSHPRPIKICNIIQSTYKLTSLKNNPEETTKMKVGLFEY